jgi:hypothetical protein
LEFSASVGFIQKEFFFLGGGRFFKYAELMQVLNFVVLTVLNRLTVSHLWQFGFFAPNVITQNHPAVEM